MQVCDSSAQTYLTRSVLIYMDYYQKYFNKWFMWYLGNLSQIMLKNKVSAVKNLLALFLISNFPSHIFQILFRKIAESSTFMLKFSPQNNLKMLFFSLLSQVHAQT